MFFKRIEMVGFKSFATKTVVEFIPGTTVVVGPNGCGKSNILDAIKWVLGEQAASQMRGKRMSDVIFAGSASFKALGVAQVTLTIDNARRILPVEYDEVQVTRRLFRSGESEYLINKAPARLRDVHNLFLGTGIGKSAYSILEQGRVDQIINAKPVERRALIEEAAGISKFKVRKLEALRKLERTDIDLSRLTDLLGEVDRQTASLKRQAAKAERYKQLVEDAQRAEQELILLRSRDVGGRVRHYDNQLGDLNGRLTALRTTLAEKSAAEEEAREAELMLHEQLNDENQALFDLKANISECDAQKARLSDKIAGHHFRTGQIQLEMKELNVRADEMNLRVMESQARREQALAAQGEHQKRHAELREEFDAKQAGAREQTSRIEELEALLIALREAVARADNAIGAAEALVARQEEARAEMQSAAAALEQAQTQRREAIGALRERTAALAAQIAAAQDELMGLRAAQSDRQKALGEAIKSLEGAHRDLHQSRSRLETLNELKANYDGYYQGVREVMLAADNGQLHGIRGVVANLVRAKAEHELAIEVASAGRLQDIVTNTADDARQAIDYLKSAGRGRATFLPLNRMQTAPLAHDLRRAFGRDGVIGLASELVEFDSSVRAAVENVLGNTIVVRDLETGLRLQGEGLRGRYVSLDGQLVSPSGAMTGGRVQATGLMLREREIRDLGEKVVALERRETELRATLERIQGGLAEGHLSIQTLQEILENRRLEHAGMAKELEGGETGIVDAERALGERQTQLAKLESEGAAQNSAIERAREERGVAAVKLHETEGRLAGARSEARESGEGILSLGASLAEAKAESEKARERAEDARQQIEAATRDAESVTRQRTARLNEIETLKEEDVALQEQITRIRGEADNHRIQFDALSVKLTQYQGEREALQAKVKGLAAETETLKRDERVLDNQARQIELERAELAATLENLAQQCAERFETTLEALGEVIGEIARDAHALQAEAADLREKLGRIGPVNMAALEEYKETASRLEFLQGQHGDLVAAKEQLAATIQRLDDATRERFLSSFEGVRGHFIEMFRKLFNGGKADLILEAPEGVDPLLDGGIEIMAQPPGKRLQNIGLLSGGEKAMTAISLLFALFLVKPSPFCVLDEIDAPLDDSNVGRFREAVNEFKQKTQFVVITHNKLTMELADAIYGVTMEESGVSKVVSVRFDQATQLAETAS